MTGRESRFEFHIVRSSAQKKNRHSFIFHRDGIENGDAQKIIIKVEIPFDGFGFTA